MGPQSLRSFRKKIRDLGGGRALSAVAEHTVRHPNGLGMPFEDEFHALLQASFDPIMYDVYTHGLGPGLRLA